MPFLKCLKTLAIIPALFLVATAPPADPQKRETLESLLALDVATAKIGYRIVTANAALCDQRIPASGMLLHGIEQYGGEYREAAARVFGLGEAPGVAAVLPGSPAAEAGVRAGDAVLAINGEAPATIASRQGKGDFDRMALVLDQFEGALAAGPVTLDVVRDGERRTLNFAGLPACASRFQVQPSTELNAAADGRYVQISSAFIGYFANDDEFAAIMAHEIAHNILRHRDRLDAQNIPRGFFSKFGKNAARIRETEIEADRFSLKLLANAGFRMEAAPDFWRRFGPEHGYGIFSDATHLRWKKRVAMLEAEITALRQSGAGSGA
ncbi:M48 family metallopeptidase [Sphingomonas cavernae]|uniref:PDZ domain-containing protein n=1 Tax=Sphingomonas cavernae TaxID=2320861 RepID=A0A418WL42_9SPHN|nr:M48 family metallopeptidase [Sphingomonas cavernae]RJF90747.1 PDZ domain-containing protein [Sphingomonas cavernae]